MAEASGAVSAAGRQRFKIGLSLAAAEDVVAGFAPEAAKIIGGHAHGEADVLFRLEKDVIAAEQFLHVRGQRSDSGDALRLPRDLRMHARFPVEVLAKPVDGLANRSQRTARIRYRCIRQTFRQKLFKSASEVFLIHSSRFAGAVTRRLIAPAELRYSGYTTMFQLCYRDSARAHP